MSGIILAGIIFAWECFCLGLFLSGNVSAQDYFYFGIVFLWECFHLGMLCP